MGLIWGSVSAVVGIVGAVLTSLVADDVKEWAPRIAEHLISRAVSRLPPEDRERMGEEWRSDVNDTPGTLTKLWRAADCLSASRTITKDRLRKGPALRIDELDRMVSWNVWIQQRLLLGFVRCNLSRELPTDVRDAFLRIVSLKLEPELRAMVRRSIEHHRGWRAGRAVGRGMEQALVQVLEDVRHEVRSLVGVEGRRTSCAGHGPDHDAPMGSSREGPPRPTILLSVVSRGQDDGAGEATK